MQFLGNELSPVAQRRDVRPASVERPAPLTRHGGTRPDRRTGRRLTCLLIALALLLGTLGPFAAEPVTAQAAKTWGVSPQGYTVQEGVAARIVIRLSEAAPAGGLRFTLKPLFGSAVPSDKCLRDSKAAAADIGANPPATLTVPGGSVKAEVAIPTVRDLLAEQDECFAVQFAGAQATVDAGWAADSEDGPYGDSSAAQVTIFNVEPPAAPTRLSVTPGSARLHLAWTAPPGSLQGYDVHYTSAAAGDVGNHDAASGNDPAAAWVAVSRSGTAASQAITGLTDGTAYRVRARAVGKVHGNPGFWVFGTGEPVETTAAGAPTGLGITAGSGALGVSWTAPAGAVRSYDVHYTSSAGVGNDDAASGNNPAAGWVDAGHTGTNAWHRIDDLTDGTTYRVRVRAVNVAGASTWVRGTGTPASGAPAAPAGLSVGAEHRQVKLRWRKPAGTVTSYDVHYTASTSVGNDAAIGSNTNPATGWVDARHTGTAASQAISGLTNYTAYRVRVRAVNASGAGAWARGTGTPLAIVGFSNWAKGAPEGDTETVRVKLSEALRVAATVRIDIDVTRPASRRATETHDFTLSATTLTFAPGVTEQTFTVRSVADRTTEGEESFFLRLAAPSGAPYRVGRMPAQDLYDETEVVIADASRAAGLHIEVDDKVPEGESARVVVRIGSPAPAGGTVVTLSLATTGTATEGTDFRLSSKTATIAAGEVWAEATLTTLDDTADDNGETVVLKASSTGPTHTAQARTVTIVDNDLPLAPAPQNVKVAPGPRPLTLTVTWDVPAAAGTVDPDYTVYWSFRKNGAGPGWARRWLGNSEQRSARNMTLAHSLLTAAPHEVGIWFAYKGEADPVAAPGALSMIDSRPATAVGTPRPPVPASVARNVQIVPGDTVLNLLWQAPSSLGSYELAGYQIEVAGEAPGMPPGWQLVPIQIFNRLDPTATSARLRGLVHNAEFPKNGYEYSVRIRVWSKRSGTQQGENGLYPIEDVAFSDWVTVTGTPLAGLSDRPTSIALTSSASGNRLHEHAGTVTLTATLNIVALSATTVSLTAGDASTATAADDYTLSAETLTISAGARSATATLTVVDDTAVETEEVVLLSAATAGDVALKSSALAITIKDNDEAVAAPTGLTVSPNDAQLRLDWAAPSEPPGKVTDYDVEYKEAAARDAPAKTADDPATGWVDAGHTGTVAWQTISSLTNGVTYDVRVRAISWTGTPSLWTAGSGSPSPLTPLPTPANFALTPGDGQITARWDAVANADEYVLMYSMKGSGTFERKVVEAGRGLTSTVTGLVNGVTYVLTVKARDTTSKYAPGPAHAWLEATPGVRMSADASLNVLRASARGADGTYAPLALTSMGATGYTAMVAGETTHVKLTPVAAHAAATITVDGAAVASGSSSAAIPLAGSGETVITVRVTAEDGVTVKEFTVTIARRAAQSSDPTLSDESSTDEPPSSIVTKRGHAREGTDDAVVFTVLLDRAANETVTVDYATADSTGPWAGARPARAGADYTATSGTLTFAPGEAWKTVAVPILDDAVDEGMEYFLVRFSNPQGATLETRYRETQGVIRNQETQVQHTPNPAVTVTAGSAVTEGTAAAFTLTAVPAPGADLAVRVSITQKGEVADASALGSRTVTIPAGAVSAPFTVATVDDAEDEADGTVEASLAGGSGYTVGDAGRAAVAVADDDTPVVTVTAGAAVTEGTPAGFTLTAEPTPASDLAVALSIAQSGEVAKASALGARTVTISAGAASAAFTVATMDDAVDEPDGAIVATLGSGAGYTVGAAGSATVAVDDDDESVPGILTKRGIAREGSDEAVVFSVRLSRAASQTVTVDYATADGAGVWASTTPARAGADYTATQGTLTFAPGETWKTVSVPILDDAVDEGMEYFLLRFSNPQGASLETRYREAQGLIRNDDHLQGMWLARFGRTVGTQVTDAVSERLEAGLSPGVHATLAGRPLDLSPADDGQALAQTMTGLARAFGAPGATAANSDPFAQPGGFEGSRNDPDDSGSGRSMTGRELLLGSSFHLASEGEGSGPGLAAWGRMAHGRLDGEHADDSGRTRVDGEVVTGVLGADADFGRLLAGVAISLSEGDATFDSPGVDVGARGGIESTMTTVNPYARFTLTQRVSAWGLVGLGTGDMTIRFDDGGMNPIRTDTGLRMGALGARGALLEQDAAGGTDLALKADAFFVRMVSEQAVNSVQTEAAASRVRLVLEGGRRFNLGGGATLHPSLELGLRHDGGDAETGAGVELGGGVTFVDAALGLSIEVRARMLLAHADSDYKEWGVSATARLDPGERGRGLSFALSPAVGATASAAQRLWGGHEVRGMAPGGAAFEASRGLHAEAGYGLALFGDRITGTPNLGFALSDGGAQDWRIGWRLAPAASGDRGFEVNLDATRREAANANGTEHGVLLQGAVRW